MSKIIINMNTKQSNIILSFVTVWALINSIASDGLMRWTMMCIAMAAFIVDIVLHTCGNRTGESFWILNSRQSKFTKGFVIVNFITAVICLMSIILSSSTETLFIISWFSNTALIVGLTMLAIGSSTNTSEP
ncbi:MAG: hypothetical protein NC343_00795 [Muribaculum sp.]|nr:hypothetical protein [Muribaculaceae bacterium]MCM1080272.1 hypothetical protein [Muribaculum sp.]